MTEANQQMNLLEMNQIEDRCGDSNQVNLLEQLRQHFQRDDSFDSCSSDATYDDPPPKKSAPKQSNIIISDVGRRGSQL